MTEAKKPDFVGFARAIFERTDWPEGESLEGFDLQEIAESFGLLTKEMRFEVCGEYCFCEEYYGSDEFKTGVECYRKCTELTSKPSDSTVSEAPGQMNKSGSTAK